MKSEVVQPKQGPLSTIVQKLKQKQSASHVANTGNSKTLKKSLSAPTPVNSNPSKMQSKELWSNLPKKRKTSKLSKLNDVEMTSNDIHDENDKEENEEDDEGVEEDPDPYIEAENKEIRRLSKLLGINKASGRSKLNKEYMENEVSN